MAAMNAKDAKKSRKISREGAMAQRAFGVSDLLKLINFSPSHTAHSVRLASQTSKVQTLPVLIRTRVN